MANFLESLFAQLNRADDRVVLREIRGEQFLSVAGSELLEQVGKVRAFLRHSGIQPGDRCALLAPNSIAWVAIDLAMMAEGVIVVPLYARQAADEGADYLVFGPVFETASHPGRPARGLEALAEVAAAVPIPVLAIGGIDAERARACREAGAAGFAAIGYFRER